LNLKKKEKYQEKTIKYFNNNAIKYDQNRSGKHARSMYGIIIKKIKELTFNSILDIGIGTGEILLKLLEWKKFKASGLDISPEMIRIASEKLPKEVELKIGSAEDIPWKSDNFDLIICNDSFHHYTYPKKVLNEIYRVLKNNGYLIISDGWFPTPIRQLTNLLLPLTKDGDYKIYSKKRILKLVREANFQDIIWEKIKNNAFVLISNK
jgi:ubiquinone/menaquinone biosynthesis C-methylase UbiE